MFAHHKIDQKLVVGGRTSTFIIICEKFINFVVTINLAEVIYLADLTQFYLGFNRHGFG
jgi:hypothetical protein